MHRMMYHTGMGTTEQREALLYGLRSWGKRSRNLAAERDPLVLDCLALGISKENIHQATGLGRSTIDRIEKANLR